MGKLTVRTEAESTSIMVDNVTIALTVRKMSRDQAIAWRREYARIGKQLAGVEADGVDTVAKETRAEQVGDTMQAFIEDTVKRYVTLPTGEIDKEDGSHVLTGQDVVDVYAGKRQDVLMSMVAAVRFVNYLGDEEKNESRSLSIFFPGSKKPTLTADGAKRDATASDVNVKDSIDSADATASREREQAGAESDTTKTDAA